MTRTIYKFLLALEGEKKTIFLPEGAQLILIAEQFGKICVWFDLDPSLAQDKPRFFMIVGTGHLFESEGKIHRGSVVSEGGTYVWHVYEEIANGN